MTKEKLSELRYIKNELKMWENELHELDIVACGEAVKISGMPKAKRKNDRTAEIATKRADTIATIEKIKSDLEAEKNMLIHYIADIDDSYLRQIMYFRYVKGYTWQRIVIEVGAGSTDSIRKLHDRYLEKCEKQAQGNQ